MVRQDRNDSTTQTLVTAHYGRHGDLRTRIRDAVQTLGGDPERPDYETLHPLDQFHLGGPAATRGLAEFAGLSDAGLSGQQVLDVGCGIGGPARCLAREFGGQVTGIDLTESYVRDARHLSAWVGLDTATRFVCASALDLPLADGTWPVVWSQHTIMNIPDKRRFYAEIARVLAPGGVFVHHDIIAGPMREPHFPLPWASEPAASFLLPGRDIHAAIAGAGLAETAWRDITADALASLREARGARARGEPEAPGPQLILGPEFLDMRANLARNLEEGRLGVIQGLWHKPAA
mgnify:CR=1 FL=1